MSSKNIFSVSGKKIVVTGGTAGIGLGVARHLSTAGARVVITGRRDSGDAIASKHGMHFVRMDVSDYDSVETGMQQAANFLDGSIDVLVLNAGVGYDVGFINTLDVKRFKRTFEVNVFGVAYGIREGVNYMSKGGSIIVTSSPAGTVFKSGLSAYSASKAAVNALTRVSAVELGSKGIRINAVLPGIVKSEMVLDSDHPDDETEMIRAMTQTGVVRDPAEMGPIFQFLASDVSAPFTGGILESDDGLSAGYSNELMKKAFGEID